MEIDEDQQHRTAGQADTTVEEKVQGRNVSVPEDEQTSPPGAEDGAMPGDFGGFSGGFRGFRGHGAPGIARKSDPDGYVQYVPSGGAEPSRSAGLMSDDELFDY